MNATPHRISSQPDYAFLEVSLAAGQTLKVESSAMATMDANLKMKTRLRGGFSRFLTKESLFINEFTAQNGPGKITIAPGPSGDIAHYHLASAETLYLTSGSYLASTMDIQLQTKFQGLVRGFFSRESFFLIQCRGTGDLWFNTYGALIEIEVDGEYIVDNGHIVAFTQDLDYDIKSIAGYKSLFFSGEGLVCQFRGRGKVWVQTKRPAAFVHWADAYRRIERRSRG